MRLQYWLGIVVGLLLLIGGFVPGFILGYKYGASAVLSYATSFADKIKIDHFTVEINGTRLDNLIDQIQGRIDTVNNMSIGGDIR